MRLYRYHTDLASIDEAYIAKCLSWFPEERVQAVRAMKFLQGQREKVVAYELLISLLKDAKVYQELPILQACEHGKPLMVNYPTLHFNMSHCKTAVAVALSDAPIGIDVECRHKVDQTLIEKVCNPSEIKEITANPDPAMAFIRIWTQKEALVKCLGTGISSELHNILEEHPQFRIETFALEIPDTFLSICH